MLFIDFAKGVPNRWFKKESTSASFGGTHGAPDF
jgi:hypothetical protein